MSWKIRIRQEFDEVFLNILRDSIVSYNKNRLILVIRNNIRQTES